MRIGWTLWMLLTKLCFSAMTLQGWWSSHDSKHANIVRNKRLKDSRPPSTLSTSDWTSDPLSVRLFWSTKRDYWIIQFLLTEFQEPNFQSHSWKKTQWRTHGHRTFKASFWSMWNWTGHVCPVPCPADSLSASAPSCTHPACQRPATAWHCHCIMTVTLELHQVRVHISGFMTPNI